MEAVEGSRFNNQTQLAEISLDAVTSSPRLGLVSILMIMIIPLPSIMLDLFLSMNITIALLNPHHQPLHGQGH